MKHFYKKTIRDIPLEGKTVLLRADYNVPLTKDGKISDDFRIVSSLPTLHYLIKKQCRIVICSHLGRPEGKKTDKDSLEPVALRLSELLDRQVGFVPDCIGDQVVQAAKKLKAGEIVLLENLRFYEGEEANDVGFAKKLAMASAASYFIQDGFGVVHRKHASTDAITQFLPSVAGLLIEKEYSSITGVITNPEHPMVAVLGGAKISDKIGVIAKMVAIADTIIIGGAMANTFLKHRGYPIGKSLSEDNLDETIAKIYDAAASKSSNPDEFIVLPKDVAVASSLNEGQERKVVDAQDVAADEYILDVGTETIEEIAKCVAEARTVVWNGTLGMAERPEFAHGSARTALAIAQNTGATSVIGGGDTADFVLKWDRHGGESFTHVSTGGGASLELMSGEPMPGIDALLDA